jgi:biuret amidohydrolase
MSLGLLIIDMQKYFYREKSAEFDQKLIPNIKRALDTARAAEVPIIHVTTRHKQDKSNWPDVRKRYDKIWCLEGTDEVDIVDELEPLPTESVVVKQRYSAFFDTDLHEVLRSRGVRTLIVAGYAIDVCVRMTVMDAYNRDYGLYILSDCVEGWREDTSAALEHVRVLSHASILTTDELGSVFEEEPRT